MDPITQQAVLGAAGAAAGGDKVYVDDVFSTFLYPGNSSTRTITNGIDLAGEGGLAIIRTRAYGSWRWIDTERGATKRLDSASTLGEGTDSTGLTSFTSTGFTLGGAGDYNDSPNKFVSWSFRKAPGFFDVVTWSGNGTAGRQISHNLGSVPGCIIVKSISGTAATGQWTVYHRGVPNAQTSYDFHLNAISNPLNGYNGYWDGTVPTTTNFTIGADTYVNGTGTNYVAYIFAHDDAVFGTNEDESIIKCGSFTGANHTESLGFEPQFLLAKKTSGTGDWFLVDSMRGFYPQGSDSVNLRPNTVDDENAAWFHLTSDGFYYSSSSATYIYMAIRRPNKPPTAGTEVYKAIIGSDANAMSTGFTVDMSLAGKHLANYYNFIAIDRLREGRFLVTYQSNSEYVEADFDSAFATNDGLNGRPWFNNAAATNHFFKRAPGFFDVVCYNANGGTTQSLNHNLGVEPELIIFKSVGFSNSWWVYVKNLGANKVIGLNDNIEVTTSLTWLNNTAPTSSVFTLGSGGYANWHGTSTDKRCIAYLFASLPGISKVGSYSGSSSAVNVDCGFTAGARFVLIKRTNANSSPGSINGDWYLWNHADGIVSGNDPYQLVNDADSTAQVTNTDYIDPLTSGFTVTSSAPAALNENGGSYIFLAIA